MDNSAARLLWLLEKAKDHPDTSPCVRVWKSVFNTPTDLEVPGRLGQLLALSETVAADVIDLDSSSKPAVDHWRGQLLSGLVSTNLHSPWKEFSRFIDTHTLQYLNLQAKLLNASKPTIKLDLDKLSFAKTSLTSALEEIRSSALSPSVKVSLIARIRDLISAIDDYQITGQEAVFDAFKLAAVDLRDILQENPDIPGRSGLKDGLSTIADLMTIATSVLVLSGPTQQLMELMR